jgi:hypothetical protein
MDHICLNRLKTAWNEIWAIIYHGFKNVYRLSLNSMPIYQGSKVIETRVLQYNIQNTENII